MLIDVDEMDDEIRKIWSKIGFKYDLDYCFKNDKISFKSVAYTSISNFVSELKNITTENFQIERQRLKWTDEQENRTSQYNISPP
jgi:hypothetical protein